jgi:hypothetical protein
LLFDGRPIAEAVILSHDRQLGQLSGSAPEALPGAVVAGDPCYDRILASLAERASYRAALGVTAGRRIVVVNSTWSSSSLFGQWPTLFRSLLAELPIDEYLVAGILHPNVSGGHSPWQVRQWLADCIRSGLVVIPPAEGWRAAIIAADCVVGDNGSVTAYAAAIDRPTLLAAFADDEVVPDTVVDELGRAAPRLHAGHLLREQIDAAIGIHRTGRYAAVTGLTSSAPGSSLRLLRAACYRLLGLSEPELPVDPAILPTTGLTPATSWANHVHCVLSDATGGPPVASLTRYPAEVQPAGAPGGNAHLVVHQRHPNARLRGSADVVLADSAQLTVPDRTWLADILAARPGARLAGVLGPDGRCLLADRHAGRFLVLGPPGHDPALSASALYAWLVASREPPARLAIRTGATERSVTVTRDHS